LSTKNAKLIIAVLLLCSCSSARKAAEQQPVIDQITIVDPYCRIDAMFKDFTFLYSDSLSMRAEQLIVEAVAATKIPLARRLSVVGRSNQEQLDYDYEWLKEIRPIKVYDTYLPPAMHAFLSMYSTRYALLIYSEGFVWATRPVFTEEEMLAFESKIYLLVADVKTGKIVYYRRSVPEEANPLSERMIKRRIASLLEDLNVAEQGQVQ